MNSPSKYRRLRHSDHGFALVVVIWGLGLLTLICLTVVTTSRWRLSATRNVVGASQAAHLAEAATNIAILNILSGGMAGQQLDGSPRFCTLPMGGFGVIALEDEGGKVDLNAAMPPLLTETFKGFGIEPGKADELAKAVIDFRTPSSNGIDPLQKTYEAAGRNYGPKHGLFQTPLEFDQVLGVDESIFNAVLPYLTVASQQPNIDPRTASPALYAALSGAAVADVQSLARRPFPNALKRNDTNWPRAMPQGSLGGVATVHVEVLMPNGSRATQRTLVDFRASDGAGFMIKEIRRAGSLYREQLHDLKQVSGETAIGPC